MLRLDTVSSLVIPDLRATIIHPLKPDIGTAEVQIYPVANSRVFLVDTPGFDDPARSDTDILQAIASCLADMHEGLIFHGSKVNLSGVIYMHSITDERISGMMMKNLKMLRLLVGDINMDHCVLVTSRWQLEAEDKARRRESELVETAGYWGELLAAGATIARYEDNQRSALEIITMSKRAEVFIPRLVQEYVLEGKELYQTAAGRAIDENIAQIRERHQQALEKSLVEHMDAKAHGDAQATRELETHLQILKAKLERS